jgi:hypothetical protein
MSWRSNATAGRAGE